MQPVAENALRFLLNDRVRHGDGESARAAQRHIDALDAETEPDPGTPELVKGAGAKAKSAKPDHDPAA